MKSTVAILRTTPATVLRDYRELMNLAGYQDVIAKDADTALKVNISWHFFYPGSSTTPWQLEGEALQVSGPGRLRQAEARQLLDDRLERVAETVGRFPYLLTQLVLGLEYLASLPAVFPVHFPLGPQVFGEFPQPVAHHPALPGHLLHVLPAVFLLLSRLGVDLGKGRHDQDPGFRS